MLKELKSFFADLGLDEKPKAFDDSDYRLSAAALLVHVATLDHELGQLDRDTLHGLLKARFDLDDALTTELIDAAVVADQNAVDFYHFTHTLMRSLDEDGRRRIIGMMWEMAYSDHKVSEFEDNVMWRVADLLGVSTRERIELKERAANASGAKG
jgi:uncharacterized tellurite resistance protein B-like protein